jgi:hypothetical protein
MKWEVEVMLGMMNGGDGGWKRSWGKEKGCCEEK